jgi:hypothetical protein
VDERAGLRHHRAFERRADHPAPQRAVVVARHGHDVRQLQTLAVRLVVERADDRDEPARRHPVDFEPGGRRELHLLGRELHLVDEEPPHALGAAHQRAKALGDEVARMRVHVEQNVAQRVREHGEGRPARGRVRHRVGLRAELEDFGESLRRLLGLVREVEDEVGRDGQLALELLDAALGQLLRHERRVEVAEGRVAARGDEAAAQHARLVHLALDVELRLEAVVLPQLAQRRERGRQLDERRGVVGHVGVVLGERDPAVERLHEQGVARGVVAARRVPARHVERGGGRGRRRGGGRGRGGRGLRSLPERNLYVRGGRPRVPQQRVGREGQPEDDGRADQHQRVYRFARVQIAGLLLKTLT